MTQKKPERLEIVEFSLTDASKEKLEKAIQPLLGKNKLTPIENEGLKTVIRECLPPEVFPHIRALLNYNSISPLFIHNLPEITYDKEFENKIAELDASRDGVRQATGIIQGKVRDAADAEGKDIASRYTMA